MASLLLVLLASCLTGGDSMTEPTNNISKMPWRLRLDRHAITSTVGTPVQLTATPLSLDGVELQGLPPVRYIPQDTTLVTVGSDGVLLGKQAASRQRVIARIESGDGSWKVADTLMVTITDATFDFAELRMIPEGGSDIFPAGTYRRFDAVLLDDAGDVLLTTSGDTLYPVVHYSTPQRMDEFMLDFSGPWTARGRARDIGEAEVRADAFMFGRELGDTITFRLTYPSTVTLNIYPRSQNLNPSPSYMGQTDVTILQGGKVGFMDRNSTTGAPVADIVFDDLDHVTDGEILELPKFSTVYVTFPELGEFTYRSSLGFGGTITVVPWPEP
jgi:hypothetical protein